MIDRPSLYVLRHGQTVWNLAGRFQGRLDSPLTALGREQAIAQGRILKRLDIGDAGIRYVSSPQGRAASTAKLALAAIGQTAKPDSDLQEIAFGQWEGLTGLDIETEWPDLFGSGPDKSWYFNAPGGETFEDISTRVRRFLDSLDGPAIVVTHGFTSIILRGLWLGLDRAELLSLPHEQGCVYHLSGQSEKCLKTAGL